MKKIFINTKLKEDSKHTKISTKFNIGDTAWLITSNNELNTIYIRSIVINIDDWDNVSIYYTTSIAGCSHSIKEYKFYNEIILYKTKQQAKKELLERINRM